MLLLRFCARAFICALPRRALRCASLALVLLRAALLLLYRDMAALRTRRSALQQ